MNLAYTFLIMAAIGLVAFLCSVHYFNSKESART